ncbi:MAG: FecR protein, partial [Anaerolineales bacterium]|nr:FecR protein [Anaerolineales bacterium]
MLRRSVFLLLALVVAALACGGPLAGSPTSAPAPTATVENTATPIPRTAILSELLNQVEARQDAQVDWQTATDGQQIGVGGAAKTSNESRVRIDTSEGTIVRVAPNSEFELTVFSPQVTNPVTRLKLAVGKLWALVLGIQEPGAFEIETPTGSATVRGSLMSVEQDSASGRMLITCLEGQCRLSNPAEVPVDLAAGEQSEIPAPGQDPLPARPMDRTQIEDWLANFPEAQAAAQRLLDQLPTPTPPLPPPSAGFNVSESGAAEAPQLALDAQGAVHILWLDERLRPSGDYFHRQLSPGGQWSEAQSLTEGFAFLYGSLNLLPDPDGRTCALWNGAQTGTADIGVYRRCWDLDWAPAELITQTAFTARDFSFALAPDGALRALYLVSTGDVYFDDLKLSGDQIAVRPVLAVDSQGDYHAVWVTLGDPFAVVHRYRYTVVE